MLMSQTSLTFPCLVQLPSTPFSVESLLGALSRIKGKETHMETRSYLPLLLGLIKPPFNPVPSFQGHEDEDSYLVSQSLQGTMPPKMIDHMNDGYAVSLMGMALTAGEHRQKCPQGRDCRHGQGSRRPQTGMPPRT